jgi:glycosyltransferase involved in cell wall biosynthesis
MLSGVVYMSRYGRDVWRTAFPALGRGAVIPNGVDIHLFRPADKDLDLIVYASAPNRGLRRLPLIFDAIHTRTRPDVRLVAYSNLAKLHPVEVGDADEYATTYAEVRDSDITLRDPIPPYDLARVLGRAGLMILPTGYPEICSNIVLQALACGVPIITTGGLGATPEWVRHAKNGMLTKYRPEDYMVYTMEIVRHASRVLNDARMHLRLIQSATRTKVWSWAEVGDAWDLYLRRFV